MTREQFVRWARVRTLPKRPYVHSAQMQSDVACDTQYEKMEALFDVAFRRLLSVIEPSGAITPCVICCLAL